LAQLYTSTPSHLREEGKGRGRESEALKKVACFFVGVFNTKREGSKNSVHL